MSLSKLLVAACFLLPSVAAAKQIQCPDTQSGSPLATVTLFDGPPAEQADLVPDNWQKKNGDTTSSWDVGYLYEAGRKLYIECQYGSKTKPIYLAPEKVNSCVFASKKTGKISLTCK